MARRYLTPIDRLPSLSVSGGYTGLRLPESMAGSEMGGHYAGSSQVAFDFSYGVDLWGGKRAAWEAAVDGAHAATVEAQAARLNLSTGITQAYADLAYAWQLNDVDPVGGTRTSNPSSVRDRKVPPPLPPFGRSYRR